jgi:hypothetical protein
MESASTKRRGKKRDFSTYPLFPCRAVSLQPGLWPLPTSFADWLRLGRSVLHRILCLTRHYLQRWLARLLPSWLLGPQRLAYWSAPWGACLDCWPRWTCEWRAGDVGALLHDPTGALALWRGGFFGKGVVSRGEPVAFMNPSDSTDQSLNVPLNVAAASSVEDATAAVRTRRRKRKAHTSHAGSALTADQMAIVRALMGESSVSEPLWLMPEEVVFLSWGIGCLHVVDAETKASLIYALYIHCTY